MQTEPPEATPVEKYHAFNGTIGDFVGGTVGTLFSLAGFFLLYLTFQGQRGAILDQKDAFEKERFESRFFEFLKFHRENVAQMVIELDSEKENGSGIHGIKAMKYIYQQIMEARDEIKPFFRKVEVEDFYEKKYLESLKLEYSLRSRDISLKELAKMNIAYHIVFFGVDYYGRFIIKNVFTGKYNERFVKEILDYFALKPLPSNKYWDSWRKLRKIGDIARKNETVKSIYQLRRTVAKHDEGSSDFAHNTGIFYRDDFIKYYGGHQIRLGHYFRHLYQMVNYINDQTFLNYPIKYNYVKTLRAQMSTYEQIVFYFNSLSSMGDVWELCLTKRFKEDNLALTEKELVNKQLITKYNLIKNLANGQLLKQSFIRHYPDIAFEFYPTPSSRKKLEQLYY